MFTEKYDFFATILNISSKTTTVIVVVNMQNITPSRCSQNYGSYSRERRSKSAKVYDPSAGSGTLLMNIAHAIGEKTAPFIPEDISQKSANMLRLNLILNNLQHSIPNIIKGNTILQPASRKKVRLYCF